MLCQLILLFSVKQVPQTLKAVDPEPSMAESFACLDLCDFIRAEGGSVSSSKLLAFCAQNEELAKLPNVWEFCRQHASRLVVYDSGPMQNWSVHLLKTEEERALENESVRAAAMLAVHIASKLGPFRVSDLRMFYCLHPDCEDIISRRGGLQDFCEEHGKLLCFHVVAPFYDEISVPVHWCDSLPPSDAGHCSRGRDLSQTSKKSTKHLFLLCFFRP